MALEFGLIEERVNGLIDEFKPIVEEAKKDKKKALILLFQNILHITSELIELVEDVKKEAKGEDKKKLVTDGVTYIYKRVNPDLPFLFEPLETYVENLILEKLVPGFIDFLVDKFNKKGIFTK
ncbi:MAG: hypothetical protein AB1630_07445 [bacterium]